MKVPAMPAKTKVFKAGNSQAVRIPKALELPEGDVYIEQREGGLFISPLRGRWDLFFSEPGVDFPYTIETLRDDRAPREVNLDLARQPAVKRRTRRNT